MQKDTVLEREPKQPRTEAETADQISRILDKIEGRLESKNVGSGDVRAVLRDPEGNETGRARIVGKNALNRQVTVVREGAPGKDQDGLFEISSSGGILKAHRDILARYAEQPSEQGRGSVDFVREEIDLEQPVFRSSDISGQRLDPYAHFDRAGAMYTSATEPAEMGIQEVRDSAAKTLRAYRAAVDAVEPPSANRS